MPVSAVTVATLVSLLVKANGSALTVYVGVLTLSWSYCPDPSTHVAYDRLSTGAYTYMVLAVPFTPVATGVMLVLAPVADEPVITMFAESCPAGMKAGSGETRATPTVP